MEVVIGAFLRRGLGPYSNRAGRAGATVALASVFALAGCAQLEKEFAIREGGGIAHLLADPVSEEDVARALVPRRSVEPPVRVAVYELAYLEPDEPPEGNVHADLLLDRLAGRPDVFPSVTRITPLLLAGKPELLRLRHAAARSQSEVLLVAEVDRRARSRATPLVLLNLLLLGLFLPSETVEVEVRVQAHAIETASGYFLGTFRGRARGEEFVPTLSVEGAVEELTRRLADEAYGQMIDDLIARIGRPVSTGRP